MIRTIKYYLAFLILLLTCSAALPQSEPNIPASENLQLQQQVFSLLNENSFTAGLELVKAKARKYPRDLNLRDQYAQLDKVIFLQEQLKNGLDSILCLKHSNSLRVYYLSNNLFNVVLSHDKDMFLRDHSQVYAANYVESLLLAGLEQQATEVIESAQPPLSLRLHTLKLLVLARSGQSKLALTLADNLKVEPEKHPLCMFDLARIAVLAQDNDKWINYLIYSLRYSDKSSAAIVRNMILHTPEFQALHNDEKFKQVLLTPSRISQGHSCLNPESCESCPGSSGNVLK